MFFQGVAEGHHIMIFAHISPYWIITYIPHIEPLGIFQAKYIWFDCELYSLFLWEKLVIEKWVGYWLLNISSKIYLILIVDGILYLFERNIWEKNIEGIFVQGVAEGHHIMIFTYISPYWIITYIPSIEPLGIFQAKYIWLWTVFERYCLSGNE